MQKNSHQLLTIVEAAARTGRKVSTWRRDILLRRIPYVKLGRSVRIPVEVVDRLIRDGWREAVDSGDVVTPKSNRSLEGTAWRSQGGSNGSL
jgi:excisionase family DNA binding protein